MKRASGVPKSYLADKRRVQRHFTFHERLDTPEQTQTFNFMGTPITTDIAPPDVAQAAKRIRRAMKANRDATLADVTTLTNWLRLQQRKHGPV